MLAESCFLDKVCTRSALNTGWETEAVAQSSLRLVLGRVLIINLARLGSYGLVRHFVLLDW